MSMTDQEAIQAVANVLRGIPGVRIFRTNKITYTANVETLINIGMVLNHHFVNAEGLNHILLDNISWYVGEKHRVVVQKANSIAGTTTAHTIYVI